MKKCSESLAKKLTKEDCFLAAKTASSRALSTDQKKRFYIHHNNTKSGKPMLYIADPARLQHGHNQKWLYIKTCTSYQTAQNLAKRIINGLDGITKDWYLIPLAA